MQYFIVVLVTCKNEEGSFKMKELEWSQYFSHYKSMGILDTQWQLSQHDPIRLKFELNPEFMVTLLICKNEEDSIKNEGARVFTTVFIDFADAQGKLTP